MPTITFDGAEQCIDITCLAGESSVTVQWQAIYDAWVDWVAESNGINSKYTVAFNTVKFPISTEESVGPFFFLATGWVVCLIPYTGITETRFTLVGDAFPTIQGDPLFNYDDVPPGQHTHTETVVSSICKAVGSGSPEAIALAVMQYIMENGESLADQIRLMRAVIAGKATIPSGSGAFVFRDAADSKDRISGTISGNARTPTTVDGT